MSYLPPVGGDVGITSGITKEIAISHAYVLNVGGTVMAAAAVWVIAAMYVAVVWGVAAWIAKWLLHGNASLIRDPKIQHSTLSKNLT
ncbi:hypothetical protein OCC_09446 [Thermococcus litoralis DSM 5473]|uniref:Uncharacterized protein n=1 Tax=Thermococcus litoralis (strain ATCC 51850 / DSM 5473 / JCM 8560 / NS-C) TaxID=523849 RepID=H3ZQR6_THELN|nr:MULTISPECIES: hypothetical protein [Thermococcus]ALV61839.1 hypothetical protein ADU37_CDS01400 [Thermococcus sp. 2319x1]EHR77642.1 hypothetical protein OCC_09446 [Thermococcus litoralis DSM 5473]MPW38331.1 hypothetical protein [Thermococcus sp. 101 C5]